MPSDHTLVVLHVKDKRFVLTSREVECLLFHCSSGSYPVGMQQDYMQSSKDNNVITLKSRADLLQWRKRREEEEMSCCTMPMNTRIDLSMSRLVCNYLYRSSNEDNTLFIVVNASDATVFGCLLTCYIWQTYKVIWSTDESTEFLRCRDSGKEEYSTHNLPTIIPGRVSSDVSSRSGSLHDTVTGAQSTSKVDWWCNGDLMPDAPANYVDSSGEHDSNSQSHGIDPCDIPSNDELRNMARAIMGLSPSGSIEVLSYDPNGDATSEIIVTSEGRTPSPNLSSPASSSPTSMLYRAKLSPELGSGQKLSQEECSRRCRSHLKLLMYGSYYDLTTNIPRRVACMLEL